MDYLLDRLVKETIKFLEICQDQVVVNKLCIRDYKELTSKKFDFIENVLNDENRALFIDRHFRKKLSKIYFNNYTFSTQIKQQ